MTEHTTADDLAADLNHALGNAQRIIHESTSRQIVPSGHAPRLETYASNGNVGIIVAEREGGMDSGAWINCENPVDTREWL